MTPGRESRWNRAPATGQSLPVIRTLRPDDVDECAAILSSLGQWFGNPVSNAAYIDALAREPAFVATVDGEVRGFLGLTLHNASAAEILVMAVAEKFHRQSLGRDLVGAAEDWCRDRGMSWLHVKTRGPSTFDDAYERTRRFYRALGFEELYESMTEWGPQDAALILVKHLACASGIASTP